ncbi:hypothetical protein [uncultured Tateyamaria sp.]|uniref:hypothetical protein n=1 Tax=uncultured Tateyamaria sp. TaxID=455651 RepID=UPI00260979BC|nr:hypothetical protein [uncultured Tateyamaria sp.]
MIRDSRVNPFNWFGNSRSDPIERDARAEVNPLIPVNERGGLFRSTRDKVVEYRGSPVDQVSGLVIERVPGGAIVRATGISSYDGPYGVQLTPATEGTEPVDGVLTYRLEAERPSELRRATSTRVRTVTAAVHLSDRELRDVRVIRVEGVRNAQTTSRR